MEERFPASILVVAGLLRVAGASRSELWSAHTTDQSSVEEGLVTATAHLVPIKEVDVTQVTLPSDSFTSDFPNDGVSHLHKIIKTEEAKVRSKDRGQPLAFPDSQPQRSELSFLEGAVLAHQSKDSSTNRPPISKSLSSGLSKTVAKSANQPEVLTTFLPREDKTEDATGHDPSVYGKPSSLAAGMDLLTSLQPEPSESAGQKTTSDSSPSLAQRPETPHTSTLGTNTTESEVILDEARLTPAKDRLEDPLTFLPSDSQQRLVNGGQMQPNLHTSEVPTRVPGLLVEAQLSFSAPFQQLLLSEEQAAMQRPNFASSPHGKMRHKVVGLQTAETPVVLTPSQSRTHSSSLLPSPETLSSGIQPPSAMPEDASQRDQPGFVFRSLLPPSSSDPGVPNEAEEQIWESTPLTLQQETHRQMTTIQTTTVKSSEITADLRDPPSVSRVPETALELPVLTQGQSQFPTMLATVYDKGRVLSMSPLGQRDQPRFVFQSLLPPSSSDPGVPNEAEEQIWESTPLTLQQETHRQMTTIQTTTVKSSEITADLRDPPSVSRVPETALELPVLTQGQPQFPTMLATVYDKGRVLSMSPLGQRDHPGFVFRSLLPPSSSDPGVPDGAEEQIWESTPLTLQQETHRQTTTIQTTTVKSSEITADLRDPPSVSRVPETALELPVLTQGQPQFPTMLATVYDKGRVLSMSPLGKTTSLHAHPTMAYVAAASHVLPPLPDVPDAAGFDMQGTAKIPLPGTFPPLVHRQQVSLSTSAPPLPESELFASSSASVPSKPPTPGIAATLSAGPTRLGMLASLPTVPRDESKELPVQTADSVPAKLPTPGSLASTDTEPHVSSATDSTHSVSRPLGLSSIVYGEPQGRALGAPSQDEHQTLGSSVSTSNRLTVPETPVPSSVQAGTAAAGLNLPATAVDDLPKPKLPPDILSSFNTATQPLPSGADAKLPSATPRVRGPGSQMAESESEVTLQTHSKFKKPGASASFMKEPQLSPTPVHAHAKRNTADNQAEGSLSVSTEATASIPTQARAPLVLSIHAQTQLMLGRASRPDHHLAHVSSQFEARTVAYGAQTPNTPASPPVQPLGRLRPQLSSPSSIFVQTELQPQALLTSAEAATPNPKVVATAHLNPHLPAAPVLPGMHHTTAKEEERESSLRSSLPTPEPGIYSTPLPGITAAAPSQKAEGRDQSSGTPSSPASQTVHHKNVNLPMLSSVRMAEHFPRVRTTQILAGDGAQDLMHNSQGFLLHLLNQSDATVDGSLDSAVAGGYLGIPSSLQYLSFMIRSAENMICLQPIQNTTPPSGGPNVSGPGVTSFQEMLISSTFLGLSDSGASSLVQTSPSSVLLVKPMFVFLPADELEDPVLHSAEEEEEHIDRHSFSNAAVLRLVASHYKHLIESNSTIRQSTRAANLSTNRQAVLGSALSSVPEYATGSSRVRSTTLKVEQFPDQLREGANTRTKSLESRDQEEGLLSPTLDPPKSGENNVSVPPAAMASVHQRPKTLPPPSELLSSPLRITSLHSTMERSVSPMLGRALRPDHKSQLNTTLRLHAEEDHHPGSVTPITSSSKDFEEPSNTSLVGNVDRPQEVVKNLTSSSAVSHRFSITQAFQKHPSETEHTPSTVSALLTFSAVKDLKGSAAANYSYSEAVKALPGATETSSYVTNGSMAKVSKSPFSSLIPLRASERPRTPPLPIPFLAFTQAHSPLSEKHLEDMNLQGRSRPPVSVPSSQVSTNSYFATSAMKDHQANLMASLARASLARTEGRTGATVNKETGKNMRDTETHNPREAMHFTPTTIGPALALPVSTGVSPAAVASDGSVGPAGFQTEIRKSPLTTCNSLSPSSAHKETTALLISGRGPSSEVPHTELHSPRLSVTAAMDKAVFFLPLTVEEELIQHGRGQKAEVSLPLPILSSIEGGHQVRARLLKYEQTQDSGSSMHSTNSTSFSLGSSVVTKAPAFFVTTLSSGVPSDGPVQKVLSQTSHLRSLPLDTSETTLHLYTQVLLSLESLSDTLEITAKGDFTVESTSTGEFDASYMNTVGEQVTVVMDTTEAVEKGSQAVLQQSDSNSSLSDRKMDHRRLARSDDVFLDGHYSIFLVWSQCLGITSSIFLSSFAVVTDDACGSGNYTSEMSLRRAPGQPPSHPDSFLALIGLQTNSSLPTLKVKSCCVTPTTRPTGPGAACCLFPRTLPECRYIQPHQNGNPQTASFTIQLFQMLNCSVAYLHCELSICLNNHPGCKQSCSGNNRETRFRPRAQSSSYETLHNLISFGPVLKAQPEFRSQLAARSELAMMFPVLLGSLAGIAILLGISIFIWFHQRSKIKTAAEQEGGGLCSP